MLLKLCVAGASDLIAITGVVRIQSHGLFPVIVPPVVVRVHWRRTRVQGWPASDLANVINNLAGLLADRFRHARVHRIATPWHRASLSKDTFVRDFRCVRRYGRRVERNLGLFVIADEHGPTGVRSIHPSILVHGGTTTNSAHSAERKDM